MRKRVMSWVMTAVMLVSTLGAIPFTAAAEPAPTYVCQVGETQYETLGAGLEAVADGGTVVLLSDTTYSSSIIASGAAISIDLNGCDLTVTGVDGHGLWALDGGSLTIKDLAGGSEGGILSVNSLGGRDSYDREKYCAYAQSGGQIDVTGTFSSLYPGSGDTSGVIALFATGSGSGITLTGSAVGYAAGAYSIDNATITVYGSVEGSYYGAFCANGGTLDITGDVLSGARGLTVDYGGIATVVGNITGGTGVDSSNDEFHSASVIDITGDVTGTGTEAVNVFWNADVDIDGNLFADADNGYGILASGTANVAVTGNITAKNGVMMSYSNATATVGGDIISNGGIGINIDHGGMATVEGEITGAASYIQLNGFGFDPDEYGAEADGYYVYQSLADTVYSTARVKVESPAVCEVDGVEYATLDAGLAAAAAEEDTVKLLTDIDYSGGLAPAFDLYINLNGHTLNVNNTAGTALMADGHDIRISGDGEFNVTGTTYGVHVKGSGSAQVTNATVTQAVGTAVYVENTTGSVTVYGNATANQSDSTGILSHGNAVVYGNVSATGLNSVGANAQSGGNIRILGDITALNYVYVGASYITQPNYTSDTEGYYHYSQLGSNVSVKHTVCAIGTTEYKWLADALGAAADGDTITLLDDIRYEGEIVLTEKDLHLDLNTYTLDIGRTESLNGALIVDGGILTIDDTDGGELNIVDGYIGVSVLNDATATVTSISGLNGYGIVGESGGSVTVKEDISVLSNMGKGLTLGGGTTAHVMGDIDSLDGILVSGDGSAAVIDGSISATSGNGVEANSGGLVTVKGDVTAGYCGVSAYGWGDGGGNVHVYGDVTGSNDFGVEASAGSEVVIDGNVQSKKGLSAYGDGTAVTVNGGTTSTGADEHGATADTGGLITVNGSITAPNFIKIGAATKTEADGVLDGRYIVYTDGESTVRLKGIEFFKEDFEHGTMAGWAQSGTSWSVTALLTNPIAIPHSGSYVAMFNSLSLESGLSSQFYQTQPLNLSRGTDYKLEFWMYHDREWDTDDCIEVQISTNSESSWINLGTFAQLAETVGWKKETVDLTPYVGQSDVRIAFYGISDLGSNMFIDDVTVSHKCMVDGCSATEAYGGFMQSSEIEGETYYHVENPEQLAHIGDHLGLNFIQTADIDLAAYNGGNWLPIGGYIDGDQLTDEDEFTGKYLGDGHRVDNLRLASGDLGSNHIEAGLFARMTGESSLVDGLTVNVIGVATQNNNSADVGAIVGAIDYGTISNCTVNYSGDVTTNCPNGAAGGVAGKAYFGSIESCTVSFENGSILTEGWDKSAGGIVGEAASSILDCHVIIGAGEMLKAPVVGGIAGRLNKMMAMGEYLEGCTVTGDGTLELFSQDDYSAAIGGIAGSAWDGDIRNCDNAVDVVADLGKINDGQSAYAAGIVGLIGPNSSIFGCDNTGDVSLSVANNVLNNNSETVEYAYAGGIVGFVNGYSRASDIENCQNDANVKSVNHIHYSRAYAGGIVGHMDSADVENAGVTVKNCANTGSDKMVETYAATTLTGGIAGSSTYTNFETPNIVLENCYNRSTVYSESNGEADPESMCIGLTAGGIIGAAGKMTVRACYSTAPNVYALNRHEGDAYYGGVVGLIYGTVLSENYCEANTNVTNAAGGIVSGMGILAQSDVPGSYQGATAQNLKTKSFYGSAWKWYTGGGAAPDFYSASTPWRMTSATSYPALRGEAYSTSNPPSSGGGGGSAVITYTVTATAGAGGSISPSGSVSVIKLASQTFTVKPDTDYKIADVLVDGKSVGAVSGYTFDAVSAKHTIEAKFEKVSQIEKFTDLDPTKWYAQGIEFVLTRGLFRGVTGTAFEPDTAMTRAMLVTVLHRLAGNPAAKLSDLFADVEEGSWFEEAVRWASEGGVIQGFDAATFGPGISLTREQLAVILFRYAALSGYDTTARTDLSVYSDAALVSSWAVEAMRWAVAEGLITGTAGDILDAGGAANRAQVATILMRFVRTVAK